MGQTSIPVTSEVRDRLAGDKPDGMSWSEYLTVLHSEQEIVVESETPAGGAEYDDIVTAVREGIRKELPVEQMGGR